MNETQNSVEQEIVHLYNAGDRERAMKLFADQYQSRLYALAYRMLGNHDDAMDALQEILLQVNRSLQTFKGKSGLYTWVYRLGSNVCLNFRNKRSKTNNQVEWNEDLLRSVMLPIERPNEDPDRMCQTKYKQFLVQQAMLKLPETQRVVLVLHDLEEMPASKIADILSIEVNAVKARLHRGRAALRRIISSGFVVKGMEGVGVFLAGETDHLM